MTREPDRYEVRACAVVETWNAGASGLSDLIAAALRAAEAEALELGARIADNEACALDEGDQYIKAAHRLAGKLRQLKPATAPAAETGKDEAWGKPAEGTKDPRSAAFANRSEGADFGPDPVSPSEPVAPAPPKMDEDGCCVVCGRGLEPCYACAPAAETVDEEAEDAGPQGAGRGTFVGPPSEPAAPAHPQSTEITCAPPCPGCVCADAPHRYCPICADRIADLETALRELSRRASDPDLLRGIFGARLMLDGAVKEADALLAATPSTPGDGSAET